MRPESLFSMQNPKIGSLTISNGGITEIDQAIAAGLCSGMPEKWYKAARLKYCLDESVKKWVEIELWSECAGIATREQWRMPKGKELLRKMCELAIIELQTPRLFYLGSPWALRSEYLGIKKTAWFTNWSKKYEVVYQVLDGWTDSGYRYLKYKQVDKPEL